MRLTLLVCITFYHKIALLATVCFDNILTPFDKTYDYGECKMRISKVIATNSQTKEKQIFTFGTASDGKEVVTSKGGHLNSYLDFCFNESSVNQKDVETLFSLDDDEFSLSRLHNDDGTTRSILKRKVDGRWQVVARNQKSIPYIEEIVREQLPDMLKMNYVNNNSISNFAGRLSAFDEIKMLSEVRDEILRSSADARAQNDKAIRRVREYAQNVGAPLSADDINAVTEELESVAHDISVATAQLGELKAKNTVSNIHVDIARRLEDAQQQYKQLVDRQDEIEDARGRIVLHDDIASLLPKVRSLQTVADQRTENEKKRYAITTELEWQENELASVKQQLEEKERQFAASQDKRNRLEAINGELNYIAQLYEENKKLNELLLDLNEKQERLTSERVLYTNKLNNVEKSLTEVKDNLDAFHIPARSVGELLETVRVDVKIDEVNAQIEKLQSEINVKESQIAEKESALVIQVKRFRSVAELDVAVTPIKAKDTILQVLDAKYAKLEAINISLEEKRRNLERAMEDYKYRILQLENSRSKLEADRNKALLRKQEEFKRDVFLTSQKVYSDDPSSVFAVTARFQDEEIETIDVELAQLNSEHDLLVERAAQLAGSIKEIKRHSEINAAEMETLNHEKENINNRYNEIVAQNSSEVVFNYLKALNSDNGTKYLLDVQQDAVRGETELTELKRNTESMRSKLSALKSRLRYLEETQSQLDNAQMSVDHLVATNDKMKEELTDIGERLSSGYEQYTAICRQLESINSKLDDINAAIVETQKTIKVNESQIAQSADKAKKHAGSDDLEQAIASFKYELGDVESEVLMLEDSKQNIEKEIFKKRLELEKSQWLYETKCREYDDIYQELQFEFNLKGLDVEKISSLDLDEKRLDPLRRQIAEYDAEKTSLVEKIDNYYNILKDEDVSTVSYREIEEKQQEVDRLLQRQNELEQKRQQHMERYVSASTAKMKVAAAAAEAKTFASLRKTLNHNDIIGLLIADKIKSTLAVATQHLNTFTNGEGAYVLMEEKGKVVVNIAGEKKSYEELSDELRTAIYVSLVLAVPNTDVTEGKWLVFEERIAMDKQVLSDMLLKLDNISYVIDYKHERASQIGAQAEKVAATAKKTSTVSKSSTAKKTSTATKPASSKGAKRK